MSKDLYLFFISGIILFISSCCSHKRLFTEKLDDGSDFFGVKQTCSNAKSNRYILAAVSNKKSKMKISYVINRFDCDTMTKKTFVGKKAQVLLFTTDSKFNLPITDFDKKVLKKMIPFVDSSNKCFEKFIDNVTGFNIIFER